MIHIFEFVFLIRTDKVPFPSNVPPDTKDYNVVFIALSATALLNELSYKNKIVNLRETKMHI